jgi:carbamoyltransferase
MLILGISALGLDGSAALLVDGEVLCATQEERHTRTKPQPGFPAHAVAACLAQAQKRVSDLDFIALDEKPLWSFERQIESFLAFAPAGFGAFRRALPGSLGRRLYVARELDKSLGLVKKRYVFVDRHEALAASAFHPSPFAEAAVLTIDGAGEWASMTSGVGRANRVDLERELRFPHSLGLLQAAFTAYLGFSSREGGAEVVDLAARRDPRAGDPAPLATILGRVLDLKADGSFRLDARLLRFEHGSVETTPEFHALFGGPPRRPDEPLAERHVEIAAAVQGAIEEAVLRVVRDLHARSGQRTLAAAGSLFTNALLCGRILREGPFERVWFQPAMGDAAAALGAALHVQHALVGAPRDLARKERLRGSLLGPRRDPLEAERALRAANAPFTRLAPEAIELRVAELLAAGHVVAVYQGAAEYGPHGLGARSFLADPRTPGIRRRMNERIQFREHFRTLTPSVLAERASEWFEVPAGFASPYMHLAARPRSGEAWPPARARVQGASSTALEVADAVLPALADAHGPLRIQTVDSDVHPRLAGVLRAFEQLTGCPVLLNGGFHLAGEPLVESPLDAWRAFMSGEADDLLLEDLLVQKSELRATREARRTGADRVERDPALEELLRCPACGGEFAVSGVRATCRGCGAQREKTEGIWRMFQPSEPFDGDITQIVKGFYEEHPFPNYDEDESLASLMGKARRGIYARLLGEQIPFDGRILEVGCGTGQLSNFLGIGNRTMVGADLCGNSLKLAEGFRSRHGLERVRFLQMNLFRPAFAPQSFDVVLCNGVLLTTTDPKSGFDSIARLVKPGGHIVIGLYNTWGRLAVDTRRQFFRLTGGRFRWVDPHLRGQRMSPEKQDAWFYDQYRHPHETKQSMGEVLGWFDDAGFDFVSSVPKTSPWHPFTEREDLFRPAPRGTPLERGLVQAGMIVTGNREGGFFIMIGRRRPA